MNLRRSTSGSVIGLLALALAFVRPVVADRNSQPVEQWGLFELVLPGPADGESVAKKQDRYGFIDEKARAVTLPGRAGIALRIRRVSGAQGEISDFPPGN
jgi:hypothetical protein